MTTYLSDMLIKETIGLMAELESVTKNTGNIPDLLGGVYYDLNRSVHVRGRKKIESIMNYQ